MGTGGCSSKTVDSCSSETRRATSTWNACLGGEQVIRNEAEHVCSFCAATAFQTSALSSQAFIERNLPTPRVHFGEERFAMVEGTDPNSKTHKNTKMKRVTTSRDKKTYPQQKQAAFTISVLLYTIASSKTLLKYPTKRHPPKTSVNAQN
jgi:hypothetical protein